MLISIIEIVHLISYQLCMTCLNWSLKLHSRLWTIPHLILTQHIRLCSNNVYLICVIVHVQMWCVCWIYLLIKPKKDFWVFYMFMKVILYFHVSSFCSTCILLFFFFIKNWFKGCFTRSSRLRASCKICLKEIKSHIFHTKTRATASWVFCD